MVVLSCRALLDATHLVELAALMADASWFPLARCSVGTPCSQRWESAEGGQTPVGAISY